MSNELVSILIPTYNRAHCIRETLGSALNQTHTNLQVVVVDNQSTDDTWELVNEIARQDSRVACYQNSENLGPTRNWIRGLSECTGDFIKVLWSDDSIEPTFVEQALMPMREDIRVGMVFTSTLLHLPEHDHLLYHHPATVRFTAEEYLTGMLATWTPGTFTHEFPFSPGCALVRRQFAKFRLPFENDAELTRIAAKTGAGPDMLFLMDAAYDSGSVVHIPKVLAHFYGTRPQLSSLFADEVLEGYRLATMFFLDYVGSNPCLQKYRAKFAHRPSPADVTSEVPQVQTDNILRRWQQPVERAVKKLAARCGIRKSA